jgi:hypothetical protein
MTKTWIVSTGDTHTFHATREAADRRFSRLVDAGSTPTLLEADVKIVKQQPRLLV